MGFSTFSSKAMVEHLRCLGVERGMEVVIHSSLLAFGKLPERAKTVLDAILEVIGPDGGVAVPTFTFDLDPMQPFMPRFTEPRAMGAFANFFWKLPEAKRTGSCIHSYAATGSVANHLDEVSYDISFGSGSFFDLAVKRNMYWVMLGCDINSGCTLIHHCEALANVPYREWINLPRNIELADGTVHKFTYRYFGRRTNQFVQNFEVLRDVMISSGSLVEVPAPYGASLAGGSQDICRTAMELLRENPYALVKDAVS